MHAQYNMIPQGFQFNLIFDERGHFCIKVVDKTQSYKKKDEKKRKKKKKM
jgi:hypothetical protein